MSKVNVGDHVVFVGGYRTGQHGTVVEKLGKSPRGRCRYGVRPNREINVICDVTAREIVTSREISWHIRARDVRAENGKA